MDEIFLFTDGSVNTLKKIGFGAYLIVKDINQPIEIVNNSVKVKRFEETSSTKLEIQTLLWALSEIIISEKKLIIYTDSQNIIKLPDRRKRLEQNNYYSKNNTRLKNHSLYQEFYKKADQLGFEIIKLRGHLKSDKKDKIDKLFSIVDKASRNALRTSDL